MRTCAISVTGNHALDSCSTLTAPVTTDITAGTVVKTTFNSVTVHWNVPNLSDVVAIQAIAVDAGGIQHGTPVPVTAAPFNVDLTVVDIAPSNMSYTIKLQKLTAASAALPPPTWITYNGSDTSALLHAATPILPDPQIAGTTLTNLSVKLNLSDSLNVPDSGYAIKISNDGGATWKYFKGDGTLTTTPTYQTVAQWTPAAAIYTPAPSQITYLVQTAVQDKADSLNEVLSPIQTVATPGGDLTAQFINLTSTVSLDNYNYGAPVNGPFPVRFLVGVNPATLAGNIYFVKNSDQSKKIGITADSYSSLTPNLLNIQPATSLDPNTLYSLVVAAGVKDFGNFGGTVGNGQSIQFVTALDASKSVNTVTSLYDTANATVLQVPASSIRTGSYVVPRTSFIKPANSITLGNYAASSIRELSRVEVLMYTLDANNTPSLNDIKNVNLTMTPRYAGSAAAATNAGAQVSKNDIDQATLAIFQVKPEGLVRMDGSISNSDGSVSAKINTSGVYVLAAAISTNLSNSFAYPVPFKPSNGDTVITFANLAPGSTIRVYTIMGELVNTLTDIDANGKITWDVKNSNGANVASGVYIYQIKNSYSEKRGKLMVVR
jgi:hypothetical protein